MQSQPMPDKNRSEPVTLPPEQEAFLAGSGRRVYHAMWVLGVVGVVSFRLWHGWKWAGGFAAGAALSALNFHWMHSAVVSLSDLFSTRSETAATDRPSGPGPIGSAIRIMLRYALIAGAGYAIFVTSFVSLNAF